jgi:hypothetical protein
MFKFSTDPELEPKIRDVLGLYLDPPAGAVVVSIDELGRTGRACLHAPGSLRVRAFELCAADPGVVLTQDVAMLWPDSGSG